MGGAQATVSWSTDGLFSVMFPTGPGEAGRGEEGMGRSKKAIRTYPLMPYMVMFDLPGHDHMRTSTGITWGSHGDHMIHVPIPMPKESEQKTPLIENETRMQANIYVRYS